MKKLFLLFFTLSFTILGQSQVTKTVYSTAGTLSSKMTATELTTITDLLILGEIDFRDFVTMRDKMSKLVILDISNVTISSYTSIDGKNFPLNTIPPNALSSKISMITIPNSVTSIGDYSFQNCTGLTSLTIPNSVTYIGAFAFDGCTKLASLTIPNSVTFIGSYAFNGCTGLTNISLSNSVNYIRNNAFQNCTGLTSISIPNSVYMLGGSAFQGCTGLTSFTISNSVTSLSQSTFQGCIGLTEFIVQNDNLSYSANNGVLFSKDQTILIVYPAAKGGSYSIPNSVTSIGTNAFYGCSELTNIAIPNSVTEIKNNTFQNCSVLTSITIPNSITSIRDFAFDGCTKLASITIPSTVTYIGAFAFYGCSGLTSIYANLNLPINLGLSQNIFTNVNKTNCTLYVPIGSKKYYSTIDVWKDFTNIVETANLTALPTINNATINLYPNPTTDYFQVKGFEGTALIYVKDLIGKSLLTKQITISDRINLNSFSNGVYMIEVNTNKGVIIKKIIKN